MNKKCNIHMPHMLMFAFITLVLVACVPDPNCSVSVYVTTKLDDTNDWVCDASDCSLREAVINANSCPGHQTIQLSSGYYPLSIPGADEDNAATGDLDITDDVTIIGAGSAWNTVVGTQSYVDRIFDVFSPATVEIQELTVHNGTGQQGGGIRNETDLTLENVDFVENVVNDRGGGIYNTGNLTLSNCGFKENEAPNGAGIANDGSGIMHMSGGRFSEGNHISSAPEGGGLWNGNNAEATLSGVEFWHNYADRGAGIHNHGSLELQQCVLWMNQAMEGGGLFNDDGATTIAYDVRFTQNGATTSGGGLYNKGLTHLYRSELTDNHANSGNGGGAYNDSATPGLRLQNVTVSGNSILWPSPGAAGGIFNTGGDMLLEFITVAENDPVGIRNEGGGTFTITSSIVAHNVAGNCIGAGAPSLGHNLEDSNTCNFSGYNDLTGVDPLLAPLAFNGASTMTHALIKGSPAIDSGDIDQCIAEDQRGVSRPEGPQCDRGAYEGFVMEQLAPSVTLPPLASSTPTPTQTPTPTPSACLYAALQNTNCRASDYKESALIAILMQGETAELLALNPEFTHGEFESASMKQCWIWLGLMDGPENPLHTCGVPVIDPPPPPTATPTPACQPDLDQDACEASGGTWSSGAAGAPACICPG